MRNVKAMADKAIDLIPDNRQLTASELNSIMQTMRDNKLDGITQAFYFGVAVTYKAIKDGVLKI